MPKVVYEAALARVQRSPANAMARQGAFLGILLGLLVALYVAGRPRTKPE
jgi:hypothetical protein